ncbi:MAG: 3'-5' exonuclease [Actinomycetia bacterium]|nr:3'-5' exonuclease [Actinomycetes bacterium]
MAGILVFDCETVPDLIRCRAANIVDASVEDTIAYASLSEAMPKPPFCQVVALAVAWITPDGAFRDCRALGEPDWDEARLLAAWFEIVGRHRPRIVGWNSSGFDLPVLVYRAVLHGIATPAFYRVGEPYHGYRKRYDEESHIDLMDLLSGYGASPRVSLHEMATACGLPGKGSVRGEDVLTLWQAGDLAAIRAYCERDVLTTALIYGRYAAHRGWFTPDQAVTFEQSVARWLDAATAPHWQAFRAAWRPSPHVWGSGVTPA